MATLALEHLAKVFPGQVRAVDDLSLHVAEGELMVLVGPSGCGKTTTLRMIAGLEQPTGGTISMDKRRLDRAPPKDRDVAMVFQNYALYPHMTVAGNMAFGLKLRRIRKAEIRRRVAGAAELLGIRRLLHRRPGELSGGQQQRVAVGRAIVRQPRVFLFDEPLAQLDAPLRVRMRREIRGLQARLGTTTLYVTHDQMEAMTLGQRVAVMRQGRIQQVADPAMLYGRPANRFVAELIGFPPMNFFPGRIERGEGSLIFREEGFALPIPDAWAARLRAHVGKPLTLGLRPEHVGSPAAERRPDAPCIPARVEAVELTGPELHVYLTTGRRGFVCRVEPARAVPVGHRMEAAVDVDHLHFFEAESGQAVA